MSDHAFAFLSAHTFMKVPAGPQPRPFGLAGIAWDGAVTNRPGARFGPRAIRQASHMLCDGIHPLFEVSPDALLCDHGDLALPNTSLERMRAALEPQAAALRMPICANACGSTRPSWIASYTWEDHFGEPSGHGTWVYEAIQEGLVDPQAFAQIGIRSAGHRAARDYVRDQGGLIWTARDLRGRESAAQLAEVIDTLKARWAARGQPPLYLSFDIDALDPAFAPGTGTPEPGGLTTAQALTLLEELAGENWVGMDCVEVAPPYDHADLSSNAAATLVWTYLCGQAAKKAPE
jgi:agmatinase